jgi:predicted anti-sigma-YlaC factor YlaD
VQLPTTNCARARESVSAQLDGELPELELDRLETHLLICPDCAEWAERVRAATAHLREARLEVPAERLVLPRLRHYSWRVGSAVAVASAAAVVATMFFAPGQNGAQSSLPQVSGFVGATGQQFVVSRLERLEDGTYSPLSVSTVHARFRHV